MDDRKSNDFVIKGKSLFKDENWLTTSGTTKDKSRIMTTMAIENNIMG